ncbi:PEP/pyruvate-binding domain-containing protein [Streptomyces morookaense]|uniref:PEP/pyruvate-binding domain-containing protein n=1 Tax=Streptomyces morookaense TaxID=1970 RepID=UPI0033FF79E1
MAARPIPQPEDAGHPAGGASPLLRSLDAVSTGDASLVGRKAAQLGALRREGFPVPPGLVLTVEAFDAVLDELRRAARAPEGIAAADLPLPPEVLHAVGDIAARFPDTELAVRSSGVAEDAPDRSYAGQYTTVLGVRGHEALAEAVRTCLASAFSRQVTAYQDPSGTYPGLAVLVQPMVEAVAAGVAFSVNPVDGSRDETVVNAVRGLGERLVSGHAAPDEWSVRGGSAPQRTAGAEDALTAGQIARVALLTREVADWAGCPQDVEWAWADGAPVLLQARPVTALPKAPEQIPVDVEIPPGRWLRGGYTLKPLTPMNVSTLIRAVNKGSEGLFRYAFAERIDVRSLGGWSYLRIVPLPDDAAVRERAERVATAVRADEPFSLVESWHGEWHPQLARRTAEATGTDLGALPDPALLDELGERIALADHAQHLHFLVGGASSLVWGELGVLCRDLLGWEASDVLPLLTGLPGKSSEPALALARLADLARERPGVRAELEAPTGESVSRLEEHEPEFAAAFGRYLKDYGQRCLGADVAEPSMREQPVTVLRLIAGQLSAGSDPQQAMRRTVREREAAADRARAALASGPAGAAERFERSLARAEQAFPLRDDTGFYAHVCWGQVRYALLELAARLVRQGLLRTADEIFLLTVEEACDALRNGTGLQDLAHRRAGEQNWSAAHLGPLTYGEPEASVSLDDALEPLPPHSRELLEPVRWIDSVSHMGARGSAAEGDTLLSGTGVSAGRYTGTVRVILSEDGFDRLRPGDVLVCPETTPQWSVLFGSIGALVTDTGGLLSHPSILAREHGIPAVVATGNATEILRDGQVVEVDGRAGTVRVLDAGQAR